MVASFGEAWPGLRRPQGDHLLRLRSGPGASVLNNRREAASFRMARGALREVCGACQFFCVTCIRSGGETVFEDDGEVAHGGFPLPGGLPVALGELDRKEEDLEDSVVAGAVSLGLDHLAERRVERLDGVGRV